MFQAKPIPMIVTNNGTSNQMVTKSWKTTLREAIWTTQMFDIEFAVGED